ncbi:MAG: FGGY family carbohydrate kinase [Actinomycetota bacterium]|nr:FGGY family carbohydrate kinase [Actinomycetota bacterium]
MAGDLVIGIDCSTTASKAVAWDHEGNHIAEGRGSFEMLSPRSGWSEQRADEWWEATSQSLRAVADEVGAERIAGMCITHQRETFVPVDADDRPMRNGIMWDDERSRQQVSELGRRFGGDELHRLTGRPLALAQSVTKLLWLVEHESDTAESAHKFLDVSAFLLRHLVGEYVSGIGSADSTGLIDMQRHAWAEDLIRGIGLRPEQFPAIVEPGEQLGEITEGGAQATGLRVGTPVYAGVGDGQAACLGAGVTSLDRSYFNLGTAVTGGPVSREYVTDRSCRTLYGGIPDTFVLESVLRGGIATIAWFMEHFAEADHADDYDHYEAEAGKLPEGSGGLVLVPYWNNVMSPYWDTRASGLVAGWHAEHGPAHLYRAIMEGITFEHRLVQSGIAEASGQRIDEHVILGGGSNSDLWCQLAADILGARVTRARSAEATNLGAGVLAAYGAGWFDGVEDAARAMTATTERFDPQEPARERYDRLFDEVYRHLFPSIQGRLDRLTELRAEFQ